MKNTRWVALFLLAIPLAGCGGAMLAGPVPGDLAADGSAGKTMIWPGRKAQTPEPPTVP